MQMFETAWLKFVRPPRLIYTVFDLGPLYFNCHDMQVTRLDIEIPNNQGSLLSCCYFSVKNTEGKQISDKAIVYCHGFNGCLVEAVKYARLAAEIGVNFCCFDFQAAGNSEGEYITLGHLEQDDIQSVLVFLRNHFNIQQFVLWGRSMGASTILLHQLKYGSQGVHGLILDSPFQQLSKLAVRMARRQVSVPKFIVKSMLALVRRQILKNANFDINKIALSDKSIIVSVPAYFITSKTDTVVPAKQTLKVMQAYMGQKHLQYVPGDHNDIRTEEQLRSIIYWSNLQFKHHSVRRVEQIFQQPAEESKRDSQQYRSLSVLPRDNSNGTLGDISLFQRKCSAQRVPQPNHQVEPGIRELSIVQEKPKSRKQSGHQRNLSGLTQQNSKSFTSLIQPTKLKMVGPNVNGGPKKIFGQHQQKTLSPDHRPKSPTWEPKRNTNPLTTGNRNEPRTKSKVVEKYSYLLTGKQIDNSRTLQQTLEKYGKLVDDSQRGSVPYHSEIGSSVHARYSQVEPPQERQSMFNNPAKNLKNNMQFELRNSQVSNPQQPAESSRYNKTLMGTKQIDFR